jgi:hypothetical protein
MVRSSAVEGSGLPAGYGREEAVRPAFSEGRPPPNFKWDMHGPRLSLPRRMYIRIIPSRLGGFKHEFSFREGGPLSREMSSTRNPTYHWGGPPKKFLARMADPARGGVPPETPVKVTGGPRPVGGRPGPPPPAGGGPAGQPTGPLPRSLTRGFRGVPPPLAGSAILARNFFGGPPQW